MNVLVLAPHPFYLDRGTPIAVHLLVSALAEAGHRVDVLTYHLGRTLPYPANVRIHRIAAPAAIRQVRPGFSAAKVVCDLYMLPALRRLVRTGAYDLIHAVEEAAFMADWIRRRTGIPFICDMDSSMPEQLVEHRPWLRPLLGPMRACEARVCRHAFAVVPVCPALAAIAERHGARRITLLPDISLLDCPVLPRETPAPAVPAAVGDAPGPRILYLGNLEAYQGIDLLLDAMARLRDAQTAASLIVAGGTAAHIEHYRRRSAALGVADRVRFIGPQPPALMGPLFAAVDILASPRVKGVNTPMKIYSYLDSGKPVIATRITSHTQVCTAEDCLLVEPDGAGVARGLQELIRRPELGRALAAHARETVRRRHSYPAFAATVRDLYAAAEQDLPARPR